jgi:hypothetical protein
MYEQVRPSVASQADLLPSHGSGGGKPFAALAVLTTQQRGTWSAPGAWERDRRLQAGLSVPFGRVWP